MAAARSIAQRLGAGVCEAGFSWCSPHMAAAARAIADRIPLVDLVLEVRDARIPFTSAFDCSRYISSCKHMIVLNKVDLADRLQTACWVKHFETKNFICCPVNSHNKDSVKELLTAVRDSIREVKAGQHNYTASVLLVGIPNVGKSAIANSLHQVGRITAEEKGKLKHAIVSPRPGETQDISSYKIASHPNMYVLDSPGILFPDAINSDSGFKLALTEALNDSIMGEIEIAKCFLALFNSTEQNKRWEKIKGATDDLSSLDSHGKNSSSFPSDQRQKRRFPTDHTQDFIVKDVRHNLCSSLSTFDGYLENEGNMKLLIEAQFTGLEGAFRVQRESDDDVSKVIATKLLNLFRTGRLGRYTFDFIPTV